MIPGTKNFILYRGSTFGPKVLTAYSDEARTIPSNLTGFTAHAKVRKTSTSAVIYDLGPIVTDGANGVITIPMITDEFTKDLPCGEYVWDLLLERSSGEVLGPFLAGTFTINTAVSRA